MVPARRLLPPAVAAALLIVPLAASGQTPGAARQDLDAVAAALDRAIREVSRPGTFVFSAGTTRAYALPGVGAVFVLPPRALPVRPARVGMDRQAARAMAAAIANLQESLQRVRAPEQREQIERGLEAVRRAQAELLAARPPVADEAEPGFPLDLDVKMELEHHTRALREAQRAGRAAARELEAQWAAQVRVLNEQTDAFRREAERMREQAEQALREQLRMAFPELPEGPEPALADTPSAPAPPALPAPPVAVTPAAPPSPAAPRVRPAPPAPPPAPWGPWLEMDEGPETGDADSVVAAVRAKVLAVLEAEAPRLSRLAPGESAVVAVDFVPRRPGASAARRTVVWRARKQDLEARAAGRLAPEEFRRRVAISEY